MGLLGAHMKTSKGLGNALRDGKAVGAEAVQVFTSSPQMWRQSSVTPEKVADLNAARAETGITQIVSHDSYLVNLCAPEAEIRQKSLDTLKQEMLRCGVYQIPFVVSHMGAAKGQEEQYALQTIAWAALEILSETPDEVMLLMETTAGSGSALGATFEQLAAVLDLCKRPDRLGICLDTCHIFVAGYDIRSREGYEMIFEHLDNCVGLDRLRAFHLNDSKKGLGSHVDRHENIGEGTLGIEPFGYLVNDPRFADRPMTLETETAEHARNLRTLRSLLS